MSFSSTSTFFVMMRERYFSGGEKKLVRPIGHGLAYDIYWWSPEKRQVDKLSSKPPVFDDRRNGCNCIQYNPEH